MTVSASTAVVIPGDRWNARYVDDDGNDFLEPVLFFAITVRPRSCSVVAYVIDDEKQKFRPATTWPNFKGLAAQ